MVSPLSSKQPAQSDKFSVVQNRDFKLGWPENTLLPDPVLSSEPYALPLGSLAPVLNLLGHMSK